MITTINLTQDPTLEDRIVSVANTGVDATATKVAQVKFRPPQKNGTHQKKKICPVSST